MAINLKKLPRTQLARRLADMLSATDPPSLLRVKQIVLQHGNRYAVRLLLRTQKIEAEGGWASPGKWRAKRCLRPVDIFFRLHEIYQSSHHPPLQRCPRLTKQQ